MDTFRELFGAFALHALMAMLAVCAAFAAAWFLWRRARALAWIGRTGDYVMALVLGLVTSVCVLRGSAKPGPPNGVQMVGRANLKSPLRRTGDSPPCQVTAEDVDRGWRVAATRKEISR